MFSIKNSSIIRFPFCLTLYNIIYLLNDKRVVALYKIYNTTYMTTTKKHNKSCNNNSNDTKFKYRFYIYIIFLLLQVTVIKL